MAPLISTALKKKSARNCIIDSTAKLKLWTYPDAFGHLMAIRGAIDVMVDPWAYIWDYAPCKIMVQEAGGEFANFTGSKAGVGVGNAISGNPKMVKAVRAMIRKANNRTKK